MKVDKVVLRVSVDTAGTEGDVVVVRGFDAALPIGAGAPKVVGRRPGPDAGSRHQSRFQMFKRGLKAATPNRLEFANSGQAG